MIPCLFFIAVGVLIIGGMIFAERRIARNMRSLANRLGLEFIHVSGWWVSERPRMAGRLRGREVQVFNFTTGSGKSRTTWSAVTAQPAMAFPFTFKLQHQGFGTKIAELFGAHEITVGDAEFDQAWFIRTDRPEFTRAVLLPELRTKLMEAQRTGATGTFELSVGLVKYTERGSFFTMKRAERFVTLANVVRDLAEVAYVAAEGQGGG
jgi:hypothetical protein